MKEEFVMHVLEDAPIEAFCSWFDVWFKGSSANPADVDVPLSTAPDPTGACESCELSRGCRVMCCLDHLCFTP